MQLSGVRASCCALAFKFLPSVNTSDNVLAVWLIGQPCHRARLKIPAPILHAGDFNRRKDRRRRHECFPFREQPSRVCVTHAVFSPLPATDRLPRPRISSCALRTTAAAAAGGAWPEKRRSGKVDGPRISTSGRSLSW